MNKLKYIIISLVTATLGIIYFAISHEWIIFRNPIYANQTLHTDHVITKKNVTHYYWQHQQFKTEKQELLWTEHTGENVTHLINNWLTLLHDEKALSKRVTLQSAVLSPSHAECYLSFDRYPISFEQSIFEKWMFFEGILKTIRKNNFSIQRIQFLVDHQPLIDHHLDFSNPWPITGFMR